MARLHPRTVGTLKPPPDGKPRYWDDSPRGLFVRVTESSSRTYKVRYQTLDGRKPEFDIGPVEKISLSAAREKAREVLAEAKLAKLGEDPQTLKMKARVRGESFGSLADRAMKAFVLRQSTRSNWNGLMKNYIIPKLGTVVAHAIDRRAIRNFTESVAAKSTIQAARCFEVVRRVFSWAVENEILPGSPFVGLKKPDKVKEADKRKGSRTLKLGEIHALFETLKHDRFKKNNFDLYVALLFETACRRDELLKAPWSEIDFREGSITIPAERSKSKREHVLPLTDRALTILKALKNRDREKADLESLREMARTAQGKDRDVLVDSVQKAEKRLKALLKSSYVFPGPDAAQPRQSPQRMFEALRDRLGFTTSWSIHDIRRTVATRLHNLGTLPHVRESILGHALDALTLTYVVGNEDDAQPDEAKADHADENVPLLEQRAALDKWSRKLEGIKTTAPSVHAFPSANAI